MVGDFYYPVTLAWHLRYRFLSVIQFVLHGQVVLFKLKRRVFEVNDLCHSYGHSSTNAKCLALANIFTTTTEIHIFYNLYRLHILHWQWVYLIPSILNWTAKQHSLLAKLCWLVPSLPSYLGWLLEVRILKRDSDCISFLCVYPLYGTVSVPSSNLSVGIEMPLTETRSSSWKRRLLKKRSKYLEVFLLRNDNWKIQLTND